MIADSSIISKQAKLEFDGIINPTCNKCGISLDFNDVSILIDDDSSGGYQCAGLILRCGKCRKKYGGL